MELDLKIFRMNRLGIPQARIAKRLEALQKTVSNHLVKLATLPFLLDADLSRGYTVSQVAEKHWWDDYLKILEHTGWLRTHIMQAPLSSELFEAGGQRHAKEEDPRGHQPLCDNFKPGRIVSSFSFKDYFNKPKSK